METLNEYQIKAAEYKGKHLLVLETMFQRQRLSTEKRFLKTDIEIKNTKRVEQ